MKDHRNRQTMPQAVSIFGLGKLGATMVGCFASRGFAVTGVDVDATRVRQVRSGRSPVFEPGLQNLYSRFRNRISATTNTTDAVLATDVSFIIVPTPSRKSGEFSSKLVESVARGIGYALRNKKGYHLVVVTSTVLPGTMEKRILPALEKSSVKRCGKDFGLCYSPEFIAIGDVVKGLLHPDFFLVGECDPRSGSALQSVYRRFGSAHTRVARMNMANAELAKISINTYVTSKIAFANTLARICSHLPGGDALTVARAVGLDSRINPKCLKPGPAFGGPCFPRDNRAFAWVARKLGVRARSAVATDESNRDHTSFLTGLVQRHARKALPIAFLGLSYKPRTGLLEESCVVRMAADLARHGYRISVHDPLASDSEIACVLPSARIFHDPLSCVRGSGTVVYATDHEAFARLSLRHLLKAAPKATVVDLWGRWLNEGKSSGPRYVVPGMRKVERRTLNIER